MSRKVKTVTLSFPHFDHTLSSLNERLKPENKLYQVVKATESTDYPPGTMLKKRQVDELCDAPGWAVTLVGHKES